MNTLLNTTNASIPLSIQSNHLLVAITEGKERRGLTELIARLALKAPLYFIAGGAWVPDQDDLRVSLGRHTTDVDGTLDNPHLTRPTTCLQLLDLVANADVESGPLLILDILNLFYNVDVEISRRIQIIEQCCKHLQRIKLSRPVVVFIQQTARDEYGLFFPIVASFADETVELQRDFLLQALLPEVVMGKDLKSSRALADKLKAKINFIAQILPPADRLILKQFGEWILKHGVEIANATNLSPTEAALAMITLEEHKRIDRLINDVENWMREVDESIARK